MRCFQLKLEQTSRIVGNFNSVWYLHRLRLRQLETGSRMAFLIDAPEKRKNKGENRILTRIRYQTFEYLPPQVKLIQTLFRLFI